ncbi:kelch-like protein 20, partial [Crotalus tigris]|uniref:kelch-like protein 20 n=1 Tax=Crotalus tigris TaxID=88082 RepID=UPI00192F8035
RDACRSYFWLRGLPIRLRLCLLIQGQPLRSIPKTKRWVFTKKEALGSVGSCHPTGSHPGLFPYPTKLARCCHLPREQIEPNRKLVSWRTNPTSSNNGRPLELLYAIGGTTSGVERYNPLDHEWQILGSASSQRSGIGVASLNGSIYAAGGHDGLICLNSVERYLPETNEWKRDVAPLSEPKQEAAMAELGGYLYCAGGFDGLVCLNTLERYDPELDRWQKLTPMKSRRKGLGLATLDGYLYAVGGSDGYSPLCSVERYDPREDEWATCPPLRSCRENLGCVALQGKIYAVGGQDELTELCSAERFDPSTNRWTPVRPMRSKRSKVNLAAINGCLLAIGGYDGIVHVSTVEAFDLDLNAWRRFGNTKSRHPGGGVSVIQMATENVESFESSWSR